MRITREKASLVSIFHFIVTFQHIITSIFSTSATTVNDGCRNITCGSPQNMQIRFPFHLKDRQPNDQCGGYPGFEVSCTNNNETVIELPLSGKFLVRDIFFFFLRRMVIDSKFLVRDIREIRYKMEISLSLGLIVLVLSMLIIYTKISKKADKEEEEKQMRIEQFLENNVLMPTRYSHAEIKKMTNKFEAKLGQGGYGSVFKGKLKNGIQVAVKILDNSEGGNNGEEFVSEVGTIGRIHHLNVVRLLGFCVEGSVRALIYEFMINSSLDKFIFSTGKDKALINLGWRKLQDIAVGIARGMKYLHQGCAQRILHFDIKPQNIILLDHNFTPKISDFGLAKLCTKDTFVTVSTAAARGTMGYIAPEVFSRNFGIGTISYKSDVYSFGMLSLEMVGGKKNTQAKMETHSNIEEYFPEWVYNRLNCGEDLGIQAQAEDVEIVRKFTMVALWCIQLNPVDRPSMNAVLQMLEGNTENLLMPPNPTPLPRQLHSQVLLASIIRMILI